MKVDVLRKLECTQTPSFLNYSHFSPGVLNKLLIVVYVQSVATRNPFFR